MSFHIYMGEQADNFWLRMRIQYYADDWLFIEKYIFNVDGEIFTIIPTEEIQRDNDTMIWEWYDAEPSDYEINMIRKIIKSKKTVLRYVGSQYHDDRIITASEKAALRNVLTVYDLWQQINGK